MRRIAMLNLDGKSGPVTDPEIDVSEVRVELYHLAHRVLARTPYDRLLTDLLTVGAGERAIADGCSTIFIDSFADYGSAALRAATDLPVIGAGEAGIAHAAEHGSYSIVTVWPASMGFLYDERLASCVGGTACRAVHHVGDEREPDRVGTSASARARMVRGDREYLDLLEAACRAAVADDGTDAVLLGCTCMSPVAAELDRRCEFPVLDPSALGWADAVAAATDQGETGPSARRGAQTRRAGEVSQVVEAWLAAVTSPSDDCDVCQIVPKNV
ncbi:aspartate/glutamate racemase family protein [Nocardioides sp. Bht2]|uniref:aspartate/glutamate racemase family protein n=1 Tax=Nocardioides sp. Bht2 TaxID=3392297 RepID=UPI0039B36C9C